MKECPVCGEPARYVETQGEIDYYRCHCCGVLLYFPAAGAVGPGADVDFIHAAFDWCEAAEPMAMGRVLA